MAKGVYFGVPWQRMCDPATALVAELVERGETVVYVNAQASSRHTPPRGARIVAYPPDVAINPRISDHHPHAAHLRLALARRLLPQALTLIDREQADYVLFDAPAIWAQLAARRLGVPHARLLTRFVPAPIASRSPLRHMRDAPHYVRVLPRYWWETVLMAHQHNLLPPHIAQLPRAPATMSIVTTSASLQPHAQNLDARYHFVGQRPCAPPTQTTFPVDKLSEVVPRVYIAQLPLDAPLQRIMFRAFGDLKTQFILRRTDHRADIPLNFIVHADAPPSVLLPHAAVYVTAGDLAHVQHALLQGVPLLMLPQTAIQRQVARRVQALGAGVMIPRGRVTVAALKRSMQLLLRMSRYRQHAAQLGRELREAGGMAYAADLIQMLGHVARQYPLRYRL